MKLEEAFFDEYKAPLYLGSFDSFPVFKNPTKKEMQEAIKGSSYSSLRFIADPKKKDVYVFYSDVLHELVAKKVYPSKPEYLLFGIGNPENGGIKAAFGQLYGTKIPDKQYEDFLKRDWEFLQKYFDVAPMFTTVMMRYKEHG